MCGKKVVGNSTFSKRLVLFNLITVNEIHCTMVKNLNCLSSNASPGSRESKTIESTHCYDFVKVTIKLKILQIYCLNSSLKLRFQIFNHVQTKLKQQQTTSQRGTKAVLRSEF